VKPQVKYRTKKSKGIEKKKMTGENAGKGIKTRCAVLTEGGEVERGDDLRVVGEVDDESGVRRRGEFLGVVDEDDWAPVMIVLSSTVLKVGLPCISSGSTRSSPSNRR
jgi:hypothetical protein